MEYTTPEFALENEIKSLCMLAIKYKLEVPNFASDNFEAINLIVKGTNQALDLIKKVKEQVSRFTFRYCNKLFGTRNKGVGR